MSRFQLIDTKTGEIVWPRNKVVNARLAGARVLWAAEDRRRGYKTRSYRRRTVKAPNWEEIGTATVVAFLVVLFLTS